MEQLADHALAGIGRQALTDAPSDPEIASLQGLLPDDRERRFLLEAGLLSVYAQAGQVPPAVPPIDPARDETLEPCSKAVAEVLSAMLEKSTSPPLRSALATVDMLRGSSGLPGEHVDLLPEALEMLHSRGLRLRHVLLPSVLSARGEQFRRALLPVIGERGRWLARHNPGWKWVLTMDAAQAPDQTSAPPAIEQRLMDFLTVLSAQSDIVLPAFLLTPAAPWPESPSRDYIEMLREVMAGLAEGKAPPLLYLHAILPGARCIAPATIGEALSLFPCPEPEEKQLELWHHVLTAAGEKLRLRQRLVQELTA
jgi:hypothetical protein